jgi:RNA polymerase sigma factor (sigma-70 family)
MLSELAAPTRLAPGESFIRRAPLLPETFDRFQADPGDALAWAALESWVCLWARRGLRGLSPQSIEDAISDTCLSIVLNLDKAHGRETFAGFAYGHFLNVRQRAFRRKETATDPGGLDVFVEEEPEVWPDEVALLRTCLDGLPARERCAVELRYFEAASSERIADALGVTRTNARRLVFNGLRHLRACFQQAWAGG